MTTTLERTVPVYHFRERHSRLIAAPPEAVWRALVSLTVNDLTVTRALLALRHLGRHGGHSPVRDGATVRPLFTDGPVTMLEIEAPHYAVGGAVARPWQPEPDRRTATTIEQFAAFDEPGWVKYLIDFNLTTEGANTRLSTETRGYSTDDRARRLFRLYWTAIRLPSGITRMDMLTAIARIAMRDVAAP